jgi:hypothetical protein
MINVSSLRYKLKYGPFLNRDGETVLQWRVAAIFVGYGINSSVHFTKYGVFGVPQKFL